MSDGKTSYTQKSASISKKPNDLVEVLLWALTREDVSSIESRCVFHLEFVQSPVGVGGVKLSLSLWLRSVGRSRSFQVEDLLWSGLLCCRFANNSVGKKERRGESYFQRTPLKLQPIDVKRLNRLMVFLTAI